MQACGASCYAAFVPLHRSRIRTIPTPSARRSALCLGLTLIVTLVLAQGLTACSHPASSASTDQASALRAAREKAREQARAALQARVTYRQELDQIPPPSKSRYLAIHIRDNWGNPFLDIGTTTVHLQIMYPAPGPSSSLPNGMLRPAGARKRDLDLRLSDLPEALAALPEEAWPYGRVIAVEEDPGVAPHDRAAMRRNEEATLQVLSDLGVVIYDWTGGMCR
jgi:hypothetical protein